MVLCKMLEVCTRHDPRLLNKVYGGGGGVGVRGKVRLNKLQNGLLLFCFSEVEKPTCISSEQFLYQ